MYANELFRDNAGHAAWELSLECSGSLPRAGNGREDPPTVLSLGMVRVVYQSRVYAGQRRFSVVDNRVSAGNRAKFGLFPGEARGMAKRVRVSSDG